MLPSQEHQRRSKKHGIKGLLSFSSNTRASSSQGSSAHDSRPSPDASVDVTVKDNGFKNIMRNIFSSNARLSSSPNMTAHDSLPNAHVEVSSGPDSQSQIAGNIGLEPASTSNTPLSTPASDALPLLEKESQSSPTKRSLLLWHGFEQLLRRIEPCLGGTPAKVPFSVLRTIIDIGKAVVDNKSVLEERVVQTMNRLNIVNTALLQEPDGSVEGAMRTFAEKLIEEAVVLNGMASNPVWKRIIENEEDAKKIEESFKRLDEHTKDFQLEIMLRIERNMGDLSEGVNRLQLESLPRAHEALYNAVIGDSNTLAREPCTPGTRVSILETIYKWARESSSNSPRIFWLTGDAGSGKSTIAYTVARHFDDKTKSEAQKILRANFFCSRQFEKTRRREFIIPTIVYQLHQSRSYTRALLAVNKFSSAHVLSDQMKDLLVDPWQRSASHRLSEFPPYLVVVDALDEIDSEGGPAFLEELLRRVDEGQLQGLKFLITSRPHYELASLCGSLSSDAVCRLYEVPVDTVKADILQYLKVKLPDLQDEPQLTYLAEKADGLFIYAATVVRYIRPRDKMGKREQRSLMNKLSGSTWPISPTASLIDKLYQQILQEAFSALERELLDDRLGILHTFLCTMERVSPSIAATVISDTEMEDIATFIVSDLHAVLYLNEGSVFWYHASFQDFVFSQRRSKFMIGGHDVDMSCDVSAHNAVLARRCFQIMMSNLRFNICDLPSSFLLDSEVPEFNHVVQNNIDNVLKYCSRYWAQHLARAAANDRENLRTCIRRFLDMRVVFWIEAMNLLGLRHECCPVLQQGHKWVLEDDGRPSDLTRDITEAGNFARYFTGSPAALSTPHLYISSLATWSRDSNMSQIWKNQFSRIPSFTITKGGGNVALTTIRTSPLMSCVAFSQDGTHIVSGWYDGSVQVWDASTGVELRTLSGHTACVLSIALSNDGTRIVSGSSDKSVRIWDASTGANLQTLNVHDAIMSIALSSDGTHIVSGSHGGSLRIWDASSGMELKTLNAHTSTVESVAFSRDGTRIASGWSDKTVRMWDVSTGAELKVLNGHSGRVSSIGFSIDGTRIISGSDDGTVRVWDASVDAGLKVLNGHSGSVSSVAFSIDGTCIVSGSSDGSVRVWDASMGTELRKLNGHTDTVRSVAFSSDGTRIVSGSDDESVRIWDASTGAELKTLNGHTFFVFSVAFSIDGSTIVSGSNDGSVRVWDPSTDVELKTVNGHKGYSGAFSSDGTRFASGSFDGPVRVWDVLTGSELKKLDGHTVAVFSVAFSSDGTHIVSGSADKSVRIWDTLTGVELKILDGHTGPVQSVAFSSDGTRIASGSTDKSIRIWDTSTGMELKTLNGHTGSVDSVAFSNDGTRIVSGSDDQSVRVWVLEDDDHHWALTPQNWIVSPYDQDRLMWVPQDISGLLHHPHNALIISRHGSATIDFVDSKMGTEWIGCYTP